MSFFLRKYQTLLKIEWAIVIAYRSETLIWIAGAVIQPLISLAVWLSISGSTGGSSYSKQDYILYFLGVMVAERLTRSWDVWELERDINEGTFSSKLLRPFHPMHWNISQNLVNKLFFCGMLVPVWGIGAIFLPILRLPIDGIYYIFIAAAILLASCMRFLIGYEFGLLTFWTNRSTAIYMMYEGIHLFLAGRIAPLTMFPDWVRILGKLLPFYVTVGFPAELMAGKLNGQNEAIIQGFLLQAGWLIVLYVIFRLVWRKGLKKYGAVGG